MRTMNAPLQACADALLSSSKLNQLPETYGGGQVFAETMIGVARGDDDIFHEFKRVVGPKHLTPAEMWVQSGLPGGKGIAARLRVVSLVFPFADPIRKAGGAYDDTGIPPEIYCVARNFANPFINRMQKGVEQFFRAEGFQAMSPTHGQMFHVLTQPDPYSI